MGEGTAQERPFFLLRNITVHVRAFHADVPMHQYQLALPNLGLCRPLQKLRRLCIQGLRQPLNGNDWSAIQAPFEVADVGAIQAGSKCKFFLRERGRLSQSL
jgi:hypothetical protein